ncbi:hypothetical protein [Suttonella ornithocola]|uniref:Uncharacterized protein n=1 Tax=Suttonella ornithocola TaxID=279832 RepID=A0A380MW84_9GAMM|nr:hypothetical protein [Suttonella ornithocola]SUO96850.1 Uncharacterised protein [Suttonella ornithocola]
MKNPTHAIGALGNGNLFAVGAIQLARFVVLRLAICGSSVCMQAKPIQLYGY